MSAVLEVAGLEVSAGARMLVRGVFLTVAEGEVLGLIGESGSGKTMTATAILRLLPHGVTTRADTMRFRGADIGALPDAGFDALRGTGMAMIFQDPAGAFNPAKTIGWHFHNVLRRAGRAEGWRAEAVALLHDTGIVRPEAALSQYAHQLSGGMLQRALIGLVLALRPALIVADEPTTNLDALVARQVIALFRTLRHRLGAAFVYITHDIAVARQFCDRVAVMYASQVIETGGIADVLARPRHPYTQGLIAAATELTQRPRRLREIVGEPDTTLRPGCAFAPRCPLVRTECLAADPGLRPQHDGSSVRCVLHDAV